VHTVTTREAWRVYLQGRRVATVELTDMEVGPFRAQLQDETADLVLEAYETGTLTI
jgi:hypothetical protein